MVGWGKSTGEGAAPNMIDSHVGEAAKLDTFRASDMHAALPEQAAKPEVDPRAAEHFNAQANTAAYDYSLYSKDADTTWDSNAAVYQWDGEEGEVGPEFPELEEQLFGPPESRISMGIDFSKIAEIELFQEGPVRINPIQNFTDGGLHPVTLRNIELAGYKVPTPIQKYCIPAIKQGYDVIGIAQTGSGKTGAYLIPILDHLMGKAKKLAAPRPNPAAVDFNVGIRAEPLVVIVVPTRELAVQIFNECRKFCYRTMLRPCVAYGGGPVGEQIRQLGKGCDILVASPGRLIDFIERPHVLTLRRLRYIVIDEADEMLQDDWNDELTKILSGGEQEEGNIKYMLFSATFPKRIRDLAKTHLSEEHVRFRVGRAGSSHENIIQKVYYVEPQLKRKALIDLMLDQEPCRTIVFVNNRRTADELDDFLFNQGIPCTSMHADRTQVEREAAMRAFRTGTTPVLIATGVMARGIDVKSVGHVINYDLPSADQGGIQEYTHRIGRTGRIGYKGIASSFYCERDEGLASVLTRTLLETKQEVPDFLEQYKPEGEELEHLKFEEDSDFEDNAEEEAGGDVWGAGGDDDSDKGEEGDGWGAAPAKEDEPAEEEGGW